VNSTLKTKTLAALCILGGSLMAGNASAACVTGAGDDPSLQVILNNITVGSDSSVNANTDCLPDANDSYWQVGGSGGSFSTVVIEVAGNAGTNTFGVFDSGSTEKVQLFDGAASTGAQVTLGIALADGSVYVNGSDTGINFAGGNNFGYYLGTARYGSFFSDTSLNADGADHMLAYQGVGDTVQIGIWSAGPWGPGEFILAWEDLPFAPNGAALLSCASDCGGYADEDYNDFVVMVESVTPVPVPAAVWLFGSGLLGLVGIARRKKTA